MEVRYIVGDVRERIDEVEDGSIDCVIADPPYGETSLAWDKWPKGWPALILPKLKPSGSMWCFGSFRMFLSHWAEFDQWKFSHEVIWEKQQGHVFNKERFNRVHEVIFHFYPGSGLWRDVYKKQQYRYDTGKVTASGPRAVTHLGVVWDQVLSESHTGEKRADPPWLLASFDKTT